MIYYTSDLHLGHENVLKLCNRPFETIEEMDEVIIKNWNSVVHKTDTVYILGDLIFRAKRPPEEYLERLRGKKHLILGNHDESWIKKVELSRYFESVSNFAIINTGYGKATLCHFPLLDAESRYIIHGHTHARKDLAYWDYLKNSERTLNAGVDLNGYKPVLFQELVENNLKFKSE